MADIRETAKAEAEAYRRWRYSDEAMMISPGIPNSESFYAGWKARGEADAEAVRGTLRAVHESIDAIRALDEGGQ